MAPSIKENEVQISPPEKAGTASGPTAPRFEETATGSRPQPVALEIPVTVNGARTLEGSDKREPFSETTKTVLVFGNGAVIRLGSPVAAGQLLFLTNEKTKKEVVCQVVKSKNYKSVSGYVELEFTEAVVGFWGMRFPSDRLATPAASTSASIPAVAKPNPVASVAAVLKPVVPAIVTAPKIADVTRTQTQAPQMHVDARPSVPQVSVAPAARKPEAPIAPASGASSLASSLASLLGAPEVPPTPISSKPATPQVHLESKPQSAIGAGDNSTEDLKLQAARLQEQLSSMLFSGAPNAKPVSPAPSAHALDPKAVSGVAARVLEIAKPEPPAARIAAPTKPLPAPIKSSLDTEEVKIPSWLEPLARNAAAPPATQETVEREKAKHAVDTAVPAAHSEESLSLTAVESVPESDLPGIGSLLPLEDEAVTKSHSGSSSRAVLYGAIAAAVLVVAGGAWYFLQPTNVTKGTAAPVTSAPSGQTSAVPASASVTSPESQPVAQNSATPAASSSLSSAPVSTTASSASVTKPSASAQPAPVVRDNTRGAATTIPAAATERISRPPAQPEAKKPVLGEVHLASPTVNRAAASANEVADAPSISSGNTYSIAGGLGSGLPAGNAKQPAAPEAPLPVGGDVKTASPISQVPPVYPAIAKNQHISGDVRVDALIDANGRVTTMKIISGPTLLHQAAMDALRQWKYRPATLDGKPVAMHLTVTLQFRLQ